MIFENSVLVKEARSSMKGSVWFLEVIKNTLFLILFSIIADTSFYIVIEDMLNVKEEVYISILYLFWQIFVIVLCVLVAHFIQHRTLGFKFKKAIIHYLRGCITGFGMIAAAVFVGIITKVFTFHGLSNWVNARLILLFFGGYVIQGMAEEVLCRGFIMLSIARKNKVWLAIAFSSLIFALMHISNTGFGLLPMINLFLFAVFEAIYLLKTDNIWGISAIHTAWNFTQGCVFGLSVSGEELMPSVFRVSCNDAAILSGGQFGPEGGLVVTLILVCSLTMLLYKQKSQNTKVA